MKGGLSFVMTKLFERDFKRLPLDIQKQALACISDLEKDPLPQSRRPRSVTPKGHKPVIFTIDLNSNKSHKMSFHLEDGVAVLRRVNTHAKIDISN